MSDREYIEKTLSKYTLRWNPRWHVFEFSIYSLYVPIKVVGRHNMYYLDVNYDQEYDINVSIAAEILRMYEFLTNV